MQKDEAEILVRPYDLVKARREPSEKQAAVHQKTALDKLHKWFDADHPDAGTILSFPTGAGKTFTAVRFLCTGPLSAGYKVLWLAHTHHLLVQAFWTFGSKEGKDGYEVGCISAPKEHLTVRVVSGAAGHCRPKDIEPSDDVVIATLQTVVLAVKEKHPNLLRFLDSAGGRLVVVFDEAHHSPAPSYRELIGDLRAHCPHTAVLGLTATPTYGNVHKRGWLGKIFPQGIVYQEKAETLMSQGILARPRLVPMKTHFDPGFDEVEYRKWVGNFQDVPEAIITRLAESAERNAFIVTTYVANKEKYGKTIIFADRWYQCVTLCDMLEKQGVRADWVFAYKDGNIGRAEGQDLRSADHNDRVIEKFRRNELDVLVNVWMLTEGTYFPFLQTVFLTRQTTSEIRLAQMVGRALRGPKFGGTEEAYIVSFVDDWADNRMPWASGADIFGEAEDDEKRFRQTRAVELISIDLVRRLARQMDSGLNVNPDAFLSFFPVGWYFTAYQMLVPSAERGKRDDEELVRQLIMVFEDEKARYDDFMAQADARFLKPFAEEDHQSLDDRREALEEVVRRLFPEKSGRSADDAVMNCFHIARHMAHNDGEKPRFFVFEERKNHNLDALAEDALKRDLRESEVTKLLESEYTRPDRYWRSIYDRPDYFESHFNACKLYLKTKARQSVSVRDGTVVGPKGPKPPPKPLTPEDRDQILRRDKCCLCCGESNKRLLQVDHVRSDYLGGGNEPHNLQTLCRACNSAKRMVVPCEFLNYSTTLTATHDEWPHVEMPKATEQAKDRKSWERLLHRAINLFYRCKAVSKVHIPGRTAAPRRWRIELFGGNDPELCRQFLTKLKADIRATRERFGFVAPDEFVVGHPDHSPLII